MSKYQQSAQADTTTDQDDEQLSPLEAFALIAAMQAAVDEVPSYVEVQGYRNWLENRLEEQR